MSSVSFLLLLLPALVVEPASAQQASPLRFWFESPASDWESEGLPIGSGRMGALVMGHVAVDRLQLNEKTLWTGGPGRAEPYTFGLPETSHTAKVASVRDDLALKDSLDPHDVADRLGLSQPGYGDYQSFGELVVTFDHDTSAVSDYRRELSISDAIATVEYSLNDIRYTREYFASYPAGVIVMHVSADKPAAVDLTVGLANPDNRSVEQSANMGRIVAFGALDDNGLRWETQVQFLSGGGTRSDNADGTVSIDGSDSVTTSPIEHDVVSFIVEAGADYRVLPRMSPRHE